MRTLLRQTSSLILSKPPMVQATLKRRLLKHKTSNTTLLTKMEKHDAAMTPATMSLSESKNDYENDIEDQYGSFGVRRDCIPNHVSIILDGNRRWSKKNGRPLSYQPFFQANTLFADLCLRWGIGTATTYIYSLKNLERGYERNKTIWIIGEKSVLPEYLRDAIEKVEEGTKNNTKLELMFALCYEGTDELVKTTRRICEKVKEGVINLADINTDLFEKELWTGPSRAPNPDLLIRTGGHIRVSNYLLWQLAHTELYFCDTYAPDFKEADFVKALRSYQQRERTFGA
ncbi:hypothetical protein RND81_13G084900 [Saponaria officinalis]|uniref:Alkyl transferase n=1 Tax=Saponaria officinalis TaxID=3572 RepID=A0AAW1H024_SAPOF